MTKTLSRVTRNHLSRYFLLARSVCSPHMLLDVLYTIDLGPVSFLFRCLCSSTISELFDSTQSVQICLLHMHPLYVHSRENTNTYSLPPIRCVLRTYGSPKNYTAEGAQLVIIVLFGIELPKPSPSAQGSSGARLPSKGGLVGC